MGHQFLHRAVKDRGDINTKFMMQGTHGKPHAKIPVMGAQIWRKELTLRNENSIWEVLSRSSFSYAVPPLGFPNAASKRSLYRSSDGASRFPTLLSQLRSVLERQWTKPYCSAKRRMTSSALNESTELTEDARTLDHRSSRSEWTEEPGSDNSSPAAASQTFNNLAAKPSGR